MFDGLWRGADDAAVVAGIEEAARAEAAAAARRLSAIAELVSRHADGPTHHAHQTRQFPVGRAVELREERDGLHAAFEIVATRDGDDALELVRSGTVDSFSVGFSSIRDRMLDGVVSRVEASLREVSLTALPAYQGAEIAGVRSQLIIPRSLAEARLAILDW